jgi:hypothetical protein
MAKSGTTKSSSTKERIGPKDLGIDLSKGTGPQTFKWLIASLLFSAPISQEVGAAAFRALDGDGVLTPKKLAAADWQHLVDLLGEGHYRRYDESTARELIAAGKTVEDTYRGSFRRLRTEATDRADVKRRVQEFTGIGPVGADIFLREVAPVWNL